MKEKVKNLVSCAIFLVIVLIVFTHCTYLFRNTDRAARQNVLGFYREEKNSLDVVFVGSSHVYRYWSPMEAWNLYGMTSYSYSVSTMSPLGIIPAIRDIDKRQEPSLYVVDVRAFLNRGNPKKVEASEQNILDSLDLNVNRFLGVKYCVDKMDLTWDEALTAYIDIGQYHNNKEALANELNWQLMDNRLNSSVDKEGFYKGFAIAAKHNIQNREDSGLNDEVLSYSEVPETYIDLLEYCTKKDIPLLLVSAPYTISHEKSMEVNAMAEIAEEYGFDFLDCNRYYDEIGIDFATDYYDTSHVNILGAKKYTAFVGQYLLDNYNISTHKDDLEYASWNEIYERYKVEETEAIETVKKLVKENTH